ncbi:PrsW family glutamic-type intramembrane protease [Streptomyces thinghirensis]|nr:PrsW family glutamic-type intramembrane protease [Streptomyces thinghirensis]
MRLSTVLLAFAVGAYACGVTTALVQLAWTRLYADQSGQSLITVGNTTSYTVAPWVEELIKVAPLLLAGCSLRIRRQWGLTDFTILGGALGAGFGLLEAVLRFGLDTDRAMVRGEGLDHPRQPFASPTFRALVRCSPPGCPHRSANWPRPGPPAAGDLPAPGAVDPGRVRGRSAVACAGWVRLLSVGPRRGGRLPPR